MTEITITSLGVIPVLVSGQVEKQTIGQIMLFQFNSPERLTTTDGRLFVPNDRSGDAIECRPGENASGSLIQGFLEKSNVQIDREQARLQFLDEWRSALLQTRK